MTELPEPTAEQRRAIAARGGDVFCEAGAGTGKTRVLVERYCDAAVVEGVELERILAFTFTERAAAELRGRIRRELNRRAEARAAAAGRHELRQLARATDRAFITTIHGFCRRLLAAHPIAGGVDPGFRVLDAAEAERLRDRAMSEALTDVLGRGDRELAAAVAAYKPRRLGEMAKAAHERLRSQGMALPRLPAADAPVRAGANGDQAGLSDAEAAAAIAARAALEALLESFHRRYEALKASRSALDFADLELRALDLLRSSPAVGAEWRARFAQVMVDEFQDTNRVQLDIVEALRGECCRLFLVGDEHQSIYRFRNADLQVFRDERRRARDDERFEVMSLRGSLAPTLAAVNTVGGALLDGFHPLSAGRDPAGGPAAELLLTVDDAKAEGASWSADDIKLHPPPSESRPAIVAEALFLAKRLRELVDAGEARRGDIVVLLRAFTHVDAYEDALRRAGLEPYVVGGRGYWSQQQVEDVIRLLAVISNPLDDEMLFGALASPACEVSPDALWLLRRGAGDGNHVWPAIARRFGGAERGPQPVDAEALDAIPRADEERLIGFCDKLARLRAEAPVRSLEALIERAMTEFDYDVALLARDGGAGRMANVRKLMRLAREFERHEGRDLGGFLTAAAESTRRDEREGMAAVQAEEHDGVRVMTVHAAKGLQFPVVAVPDLGRRLNAGHRHGDILIGGGGDDAASRFGMRLVFPSAESFGLWELAALNEEESAAEAEEGCRLVYVAASRAQDRLVLSGVYKASDLETDGEERPSDTPLRRILPHLAEAGWDGGDAELELPAPRAVDGSPVGVAARLAINVNRPSVAQAEGLTSFPLPPVRPSPAEAGGTPPLIEGLPRPIPVGHLSYTALADYERCGYRFYAERVLGLRPGAIALGDSGGAGADQSVELDAEAEGGVSDGDPRAASLALGNAVHAALEWSARKSWREPPGGMLRRLLSVEGAGDRGLEERAHALVGAWLRSGLRRELERQDTRPEVPFVVSLAGTSVIRGKIDLLARSRRERTVVDFKTDALAGSSATELGRRYEAQRELYALAVAGEDGAPVRAIHVFLEDAENPVCEELGPLEIAAARERLERLIEAIRAGGFAPTDSPSTAVCFGCPAAAHLCPVAAWRPQWQ